MSKNKETNNKPMKKLQLRGISASVFANQSENGVTFYKVSITRTFKDGDEFKTTSTFSRDDLPIVQELSRQAWLTILKAEAEANASARQED
ncbi:MAG: hypothetical protein R3C18_13860 [Planctomycetaceae bacterium]